MSSGYCVNVPKCELKHSICETCVCGLDKVSGDKLVSESQFFAWLLLVGTGIAATIVICCVRIFSKFTYSQANYVQLYRVILLDREGSQSSSRMLRRRYLMNSRKIMRRQLRNRIRKDFLNQRSFLRSTGTPCLLFHVLKTLT